MRDRSFFNSLESLPFLDITTIVEPNSTALVVAPHPDDETLGCGGAIALLRQLGIAVKVVVVSDGTKSHPNSKTYPPTSLKKLREGESLAALAILGVAPEAVAFFGMPDGAVPNFDGKQGRQGKGAQRKDIGEYEKAIALCQQYLQNTKPSIVFLPWRKDPHPDHRASWQLFVTAINNLNNPLRIIEYPIWDWDTAQRQDFPKSVKARRLDIRSVLELKQQAIAKYQSQISDLIKDDPQGFRLTPEMLQNFTQPWEIYLEILPFD